MQQSLIGPRKKALIVKFGQIGDVIMALPAARSLYEHGYSIDWVCGQAAQPLLAAYSWIHVISVDDRAILRGTLWEKGRTHRTTLGQVRLPAI